MLVATLQGLHFRCDKCEKCFNLDVKCAFIRPAAIEEGEEEAEAVVVGTHHFTHHEHPLLLLRTYLPTAFAAAYVEDTARTRRPMVASHVASFSIPRVLSCRKRFSIPFIHTTALSP
jgi:hypothetical protein